MDELISKQRKEAKELQAIIQSLKRSVPKGDKKRKKEVTLEIAKLEYELNAKHERELNEFKTNSIVTCDEVKKCEQSDECVNENSIDTRLTQVSIDDGAQNDDHSVNDKVKISKARRKREKKQQQERERRERIAKEEAESGDSIRTLEEQKLNSLLSDRGLTVYEIPSDGDCMYKAIEHQLSFRNLKFSMQELRRKAAAILRERKDEFLPFLTSRETNDLMTDEEFEKYCDEIANTKAWGGQVELKALSYFLKIPIEVCQASGPSIKIGEECGGTPLILSYHRHAYHLGEHYNSVVQKS
ncbi:OTU domain-containing protein 6B-like protein [Dinothrombium tinctorium]|uniref:ubiquitinyl hydrolase 1 n=1 Tax=Dinothrombium tinctorium TaxID=1965070 RepID=A0A443QMB4_9ACAR|nr:OTU domain-containing protein 6B-like protein [Dinothrombium tinctorium]RWS08412.1 OTU domain-containing protein 6B-like protein [Dinothrombium tinctorium]